jgi:hypothetical protein
MKQLNNIAQAMARDIAFKKNARRKKSKPKLNLADPLQRRQWWINKVCYYAHLFVSKEASQALRQGLKQGLSAAKKQANDIWKMKDNFENLIERKYNDYDKRKEDFRQRNRDRLK